MRHADSLAEKLAWVLLRDRRILGLKFRRQVPIEKFIVDFYCHELRLIIELDGGVHNQPSRMKKDTRRNARLRHLGYQLLRVPNGIVMKDQQHLLKRFDLFYPHPPLRGTLSQRARDKLLVLSRVEMSKLQGREAAGGWFNNQFYGQHHPALRATPPHLRLTVTHT